jgi:3-oxoacyl-[acyl-carrier protein] reductase
LIDLTDRKVLITGGSRGIGAAAARLFAQAGATVLVHYGHQDQAAQDVVRSLREFADRPHFSFKADLRDPQAVENLVNEAGVRWRGLDCLVNNAGIWVHNPLATLNWEHLEETWKVNQRAPFLCASLALPLLAASSDGNIINISSTAGQRGEAFYSPYAATKGALIATTKAWSSELAPDIRVNAVAPGWVDTDMCIAAFASEGRRAIESTIPIGRVATPEDIAGPIVFLASPLARHVTGETLSVNGGSVLTG